MFKGRPLRWPATTWDYAFLLTFIWTVIILLSLSWNYRAAHSKNIDKLSKMARLINCSIFVKNGPCYSGLGEGGEGHTSFTIASPTGEGMTDARTFSRLRRCVLVDQLRIV